jgi:hypothetical protein
MSNFFDKSDLTRKDVDEIVSETLKIVMMVNYILKTQNQSQFY